MSGTMTILATALVIVIAFGGVAILLAKTLRNKHRGR